MFDQSRYENKYRCHVCGKAGKPPARYATRSEMREELGEGGLQDVRSVYHTWEEVIGSDYSREPLNLHRCPHCRKWVCRDCCGLGINEYAGFCDKCVPSWQKKLRAEAAKEEQEKVAKAEALAEPRRREEEARNNRLKVDREAHRLRSEGQLKVYRAKFHCRISGCTYQGNPIGWPWKENYDWDIPPSDLRKCKKCGQLACPKHLYLDVCANCAKK